MLTKKKKILYLTALLSKYFLNSVCHTKHWDTLNCSFKGHVFTSCSGFVPPTLLLILPIGNTACHGQNCIYLYSISTFHSLLLIHLFLVLSLVHFQRPLWWEKHVLGGVATVVLSCVFFTMRGREDNQLARQHLGFILPCRLKQGCQCSVECALSRHCGELIANEAPWSNLPAN